MPNFKNMFSVDFSNGEARRVDIGVIYQGNAYANRIGAVVTDNGVPVNISGQFYGTFINSNNQTIPLVGGVVSGNIIYCDLAPECYAVEGAATISIGFLAGSTRITVLSAHGYVSLTDSGSAIDPGSIIPSVAELIADIEEAREGIPAGYSALLESIAPLYTGLSFPVAAGQFCWYNGALYRAIVDIPSAESWTAAHWEAASMGNDLAARIDSLEGALGNTAHKHTASDYTWEIGKNISASGDETSAAGFARSGFIPVQAGGGIINQTGDVGVNSKTTSFLVNEYNASGTWLSRAQIQADEPYTFGANCASIRIGYGYPQSQSVTMTRALLDAYFAAATLEEGATKSDVQAINRQISDYVTDVPAGYTRVESLASTVGGNQYCSMGRKLNQDSRIVLTFALTRLERSGLEYICGARYASGNNEMTIGISASNHMRIGYGDAYVITDVIINDTNPHTVDVNKNSVYFDGALVETLTYETFETEGNGYLFGITSHTGTSYSAVKILRCLVYDNGTLVSDYIPVVNVSTGLGGMYDLVQHSFKRNPSETPLVTGPVQSISNNSERIGALEGAMGSAQAAISANAGSIDGANSLINAIHGFVNYGYDTPANLAANPASTGAAKIGVKRNGINVVLNGTNDISSGTNTIKIKLNGTVSRVTASADVKAWEGISLETGKRYTVVSRFLGGSMVENGVALAYKGLSVYRAGENDTIGTSESHDNIAERSFVAEEGVTYNFALYIPNGAVYDNAQLMITLETATSGGGGGAREYIEPEANRVAEKVRNVQKGKTLTFVACSDLHYLDGNATVNNALVDMRDGIKAIAEQVHLDFYACFGDIIYRLAASQSTTSFDTGKTEIIAVTKLLNDAFGIAPQIRIVGNHDPNCEGATGYFTPNQLNSFIGIYSNMLEKVESMPNQGVGYHDFERQKIRVIVVNTSYYESAPAQGETYYRFGPEQTYQMCQMMDISAKPDAGEWQLMIFAHIHLATTNHAMEIGRYTAALNAYVNGGEWSTREGTGYSYDFSGKNSAQLALYINGHAHYYRALNMRHVRYNGDILSTLPMAALYVPNALPERDGTSMDGVTYTKTAKTAESTAFQVITIDPESKTVYAHHWGAGIDIILHYDPTEETSFSTTLTSPTWASNDVEIATVSGGAVTPVAEGYVVIWAKSETDNTIECWNFHSVV